VDRFYFVWSVNVAPVCWQFPQEDSRWASRDLPQIDVCALLINRIARNPLAAGGRQRNNHGITPHPLIPYSRNAKSKSKSCLLAGPHQGIPEPSTLFVLHPSKVNVELDVALAVPLTVNFLRKKGS